MDWTLFSAAVPALLLLWRLALDFIPMYPLNDVSRRNVTSRNRDVAVHYAPLGLALLLNLSPNRFSVGLALLIAVMYAAVHAVSCWLPYLRGGSDTQKKLWEQAFGRTHRFLPPIRDHLVPDTAHVVTGVLAVAMIIGSLGHFLDGQPLGKPGARIEETSGKTGESVKLELPSVESAFTQAGQKPEQLLIALFGTAASSLDAAINAINHPDIVQAMIDAHSRGVQVRVITDRSESAHPAQAGKLRSLLEAGIPVKENVRKGLMDLKMSVIDDQAATTGSFNYTVNAATANDEMLVVVRDPVAIKQWKAQFDAMWNDTVNFRDSRLGKPKN